MPGSQRYRLLRRRESLHVDLLKRRHCASLERFYHTDACQGIRQASAAWALMNGRRYDFRAFAFNSVLSQKGR